MPTFLAPYRVALLQLDLDRAVTALVSCYGFRYRCGRAVVGGLACEGWWGVGFAGHGGNSTGGGGSLRGVEAGGGSEVGEARDWCGNVPFDAKLLAAAGRGTLN